MHGRVEKGENNGKMRILALPSARAPRSASADGKGRLGVENGVPQRCPAAHSKGL